MEAGSLEDRALSEEDRETGTEQVFYADLEPPGNHGARPGSASVARDNV